MDISWMPKNMQKKFAGKGLGDIVKESIDTVSGGRIKQCGGCKKRQALLNKMLKFDDVIEEELETEGIDKEDCLPCAKKRIAAMKLKGMAEEEIAKMEAELDRRIKEEEAANDSGGD